MRTYISLYFPHIDEKNKRHTKNVCIAFNEKEQNLYNKAKKISTTEIKKRIAIFSYSQLLKISQKEDKKPALLIKLRLKEKIFGEDKQIKRNITFNPDKIRNWIKLLDKKKHLEIIKFLRRILEDI